MKADFCVMTLSFDNSYARLPERFYARLPATPVAAPRLLKLNTALALELGLDPAALASAHGVAALAGNLVPEGAEPIAQAYAGHQFGGFSPQLGDGRAILLGEVIRPDGARRDIQLKGSGPTPWSRRGDGRAGLGPVLREYIISEAMAALGIPTTRSLAVLATGEEIYRETPVPGAVLTRIAASHIRVGTFQYFAARGDEEALVILAEYARARHHPQAEGDDRVRGQFADPTGLDAWAEVWRAALAGTAPAAAMRALNPAFIPRNHMVEEALSAAVSQGDMAPFERLVQVLARPFEDQPDAPRHAQPPRAEERVLATFCGT